MKNKFMNIPVIIFLAFLVFVVISSLIPASYNYYIPGLSDKMAHGIIYAVLALLLCNVIGKVIQPNFIKISLYSVTIASSIGGAIELLQFLSATRSPEIGDFFANFAGAIFGSFVWVIIRMFR